MLRRLRQHQQQQQQQRHLTYNDHDLSRAVFSHHPQHPHNVGTMVARGSPSQMSMRSVSVDSHHYGHHHHHPSQSIHPMAQQRSFDHGISNQLPSHHQHQMQLVSGVMSSSSNHHHALHHVAPSPSPSFTSQSVRPLRVSSIRDADDVTGSSSRRRPHPKGKVM